MDHSHLCESRIQFLCRSCEQKWFWINFMMNLDRVKVTAIMFALLFVRMGTISRREQEDASKTKINSNVIEINVFGSDY